MPHTVCLEKKNVAILWHRMSCDPASEKGPLDPKPQGGPGGDAARLGREKITKKVDRERPIKEKIAHISLTENRPCGCGPSTHAKTAR